MDERSEKRWPTSKSVLSDKVFVHMRGKLGGGPWPPTHWTSEDEATELLQNPEMWKIWVKAGPTWFATPEGLMVHCRVHSFS